MFMVMLLTKVYKDISMDFFSFHSCQSLLFLFQLSIFEPLILQTTSQRPLLDYAQLVPAPYKVYSECDHSTFTGLKKNK